MIPFDVSQLSHESVEVGVADLGVVERVVPLVVMGDLGPEFIDAKSRSRRVDGSDRRVVTDVGHRRRDYDVNQRDDPK